MNLLHKIFFPGVPYPGAVIWHIILGGIIAALLGAIIWDYRGEGYSLPTTGAGVAIILGFLVHLIYKKQ